MKLAPDDVKYETTTRERKRSLVIHDVKPEDAGKYVCEVGDHRTTADVEVLKPTEKGSAIIDICRTFLLKIGTFKWKYCVRGFLSIMRLNCCFVEPC